MDKNIIFYSNHCPHSKRVIKMLNEEKIGTNLVRVCIDVGNIRIPSFITSVPTIYLTRNKQILTDNRLEQWLTTLREKKESKKLTPYCMANSSFSENFSFLDGGDQIPNYNFSDYESENAKMNTPEIHSDKKGVNKKYERLLEQRQKDTLNRGAQRI